MFTPNTLHFRTIFIVPVAVSPGRGIIVVLGRVVGGNWLIVWLLYMTYPSFQLFPLGSEHVITLSAFGGISDNVLST